MKGLRKYLSPFAPDQSGASAVLYALGGILVICDAGGCAGNICGFDEPRWFTHKSAIFSAGLRDMDAILGRDDRLVAKLKDASEKLPAKFAAIIGTPVPAVIATDYRALRRMAEKRVDLPVLTVDSDGMELYDAGAEKAYLALMERFAVEKQETEAGAVGILGMTPLDFGEQRDEQRLRQLLTAQGWKHIYIYGYGTLEEIEKAPAVEKNLVVSPSGLKAAKYLREKFGTPYECHDPLAEEEIDGLEVSGRRILMIHQQVRANSLREALERRGAARVDTATWFLKKPELSGQNDLLLKEEDQLEALLASGKYDLLLADRAMWPLAPAELDKYDLPHFAVSGRTEKPWTAS